MDSETRVSNRELNIREFERRQAVLSSLPRVLFVELTENCNLSCTMCRSNGPFDRSRNMSPELFDAVAAELFPTAEIVDLRGWGESTVLKDFPAYVEKALDYGVRLRLVTNLTVPNEVLWRRLVSTRSLIAVSFDAAEPETFAALRPGAKLNVILRNLEILADEAAVSGVGTAGIHLNVVVQPAAIAELTGIVRHAARLGIRVHLNPLSTGHDDPDNLRFHRAEMSAALAEMAAVAEAEQVDVQLNTALDPSWSLMEHADKTCTHPWMYCYVNYRGQVGFCDHLIGVPDQQYLLGDLTTHSFAEIWNGELYQRLRTEHSGGVLSNRFEECRWCYRNRYIDFDEESYPPYAEHRVMLDQASCKGFTVGPDEPHRRVLPLTVNA
ncbi:radical SAM protein [Micromonospora aurantiaca (nom. illeg.)]|uniref:radical SAM protein n=2 Tax=Micromonospora TaxID=1873 RepID=UPI001C969F77